MTKKEMVELLQELIDHGIMFPPSDYGHGLSVYDTGCGCCQGDVNIDELSPKLRKALESMV